MIRWRHIRQFITWRATRRLTKRVERNRIVQIATAVMVLQRLWVMYKKRAVA